VKVTDSSHRSFNKKFSLNVIENEAPTSLILAGDSVVAENSDGVIIGNFTLSDPDASDSHSFVLSGSDAALFEISGQQLKLKEGVSADFEDQPSYSVTVTATDSGYLSITEDFVIAVADANDAAVMSVVDQGMAEGDAAVSGTVSHTDSDANNGDNVFQVIASGTASTKGYGSYSLSSEGSWTYTLNNEHSVIDGLRANQSTTDSIKVMAEDGTMTIMLSASDVEGDGLTFSAISYEEGIDTLIVNNDLDQLTIQLIESWFGTDSIMVIVSDGFLNDSEVFELTVTPVNDPPVFISTPIEEATEDIIFSYTVEAEDYDGDSLTFTATVLPGWLTINGTATISGTPTNDDVGSHNVVLTVSDGIVSLTQAFLITVENVNDAPVLHELDADTTDEDTPLTITLSASDVDDTGLIFSTSITSEIHFQRNLFAVEKSIHLLPILTSRANS
jgi:VCBS repeat-containing protein